MKIIASTAIAASLVLAAPAFAQVVTMVELPNETVVEPFGLTVGELERLSITDAAGTRLGDIEEVIGTAQDGATALVIDAENSESNFVVPLERFSNNNGVITVDVTAEELATLPVYDD